MHRYMDKDGKEHVLNLNLGTRRRLKELLNVDLLAAAADPKVLDAMLTALATDQDHLLAVLSVVECIRVEELEEAFDGTTLDVAATALVEEIIAFFPESSPVRRPLLDLMQKAQAYRDKAVKTISDGMLQQVSSLDLDTVFSSSETSTNGFGASPLSADSAMQPTAMI